MKRRQLQMVCKIKQMCSNRVNEFFYVVNDNNFQKTNEQNKIQHNSSNNIVFLCLKLNWLMQLHTIILLFLANFQVSVLFSVFCYPISHG